MSSFLRHCVECPKCLTRYLIAFSPYCNGSYLVPTVVASPEEYLLYCSCGRPPVSSRWKWSEVRRYSVSKAAHDTAGNRAGRRWIEIVRDKRNCSLNPIARERNSNEPDRVKSDSYVAPEYRQFDFWIGDWDVFDVDSPTTRVARIRVDRILDGCVLLGRLSRHRRSERSEFQSLR